MKASMPSLSNPIELSSPAAVSTVRQGGFPTRGSAVIVLGMTAPRLSEIDQMLHLARVPERAAGHENRIGQLQPAQPHAEIDI